MPRTEVYQLRLTAEEKTELASLAALNGGSIAGLIRETYGLGNRSRRYVSVPLARSSTAEQPPVKRPVEGSTPSAPVRVEADGSPATCDPQDFAASRHLEALIQQLKNQGYTTPVAERMARKQLGL